MPNQFAIIIHSYPTSPGRQARAAFFDPRWWYRFIPSRAIAFNAAGSALGRAEGFLVVLNYSALQLQRLPLERLFKRTVGAGKKASRLGARIVGIGQPLLHALGDSTAAFARQLKPTVTSGAGTAAAAAIDGMGKAAALMGIDPGEASVLVMGAAEPLGSACTQILALDGFDYLTLVDRDRARLDYLARRVLYDYGVACKISTQVSRAVARADLIVVAGERAKPGLDSSEIKPGTVVCNLSAVPRLTLDILHHRPDVMIFDQAVLRLPGETVLDYDLGLPEREIYAPMAEAILMALEGRFDRYFLGPEMRVEKILDMRNLSRKHGFILSGFAALSHHFDFAGVRAIKNNRPA